MKKLTLVFFGLVFGLSGFALTPARSAEPPWYDVTGAWRIDIQSKRRQCQWQGQVRLELKGTLLSGAGEAAPPAAQRFCPRLKGRVEGSVGGQIIQFGFATGRLGTGEFDGLLQPGGRLMKGTWLAGSAAGTWTAERLE